MIDDQESGIIHVVDDEGNQHEFEVLDAVEDDDGRFVAVVPLYNDPEEMLDDDGELIILRVTEEDGETYLEPIEDDEEFNRIGAAFEERLADLFDITEE